jgi:tRNA A37 methylthiotransferase MiaB
LTDDVPKAVKKERLQELLNTFNSIASQQNNKLIGTDQLVLVERVNYLLYACICVQCFLYADCILQVSKRSDLELAGRTDGNIAVVFPNEVAISENGAKVMLKPGDYVHVKVGLCYVCDVYLRVMIVFFTDHECYISHPP